MVAWKHVQGGEPSLAVGQGCAAAAVDQQHRCGDPIGAEWRGMPRPNAAAVPRVCRRARRVCTSMLVLSSVRRISGRRPSRLRMAVKGCGLQANPVGEVGAVAVTEQ
jgi:hypothetical protein